MTKRKLSSWRRAMRGFGRSISLVVIAAMAALAVGWTPHERSAAAPGAAPDDDRVCHQYDCGASGLRWHTDLGEARAEARASGKPILSLRLLGRLDEDLSCSNSRFFRTVLYPDPRVRQALLAGFVLHWESLRPAPRITVDFGDGRKLVRTITGNSVHYVLDAEGRVIDAIPGLYSPPGFLRQIEPARRQALAVAGLDDARWRAEMVEWHVRRSVQQTDPVEPLELAPQVAPAAVRAQILYSGKSLLERPLPALVAGTPTLPLVGGREGEPRPEVARERRLADRGAEASLDEARLSEASLELMRRKLGSVSDEMRQTFERTIARDSAFNERYQHRRIHTQLAVEPYGGDLHALDGWLHAELFLIPLDDPWYGLVDTEVYAALDGNGLVTGPR